MESLAGREPLLLSDYAWRLQGKTETRRRRTPGRNHLFLAPAQSEMNPAIKLMAAFCTQLPCDAVGISFALEAQTYSLSLILFLRCRKSVFTLLQRITVTVTFEGPSRTPTIGGPPWGRNPPRNTILACLVTFLFSLEHSSRNRTYVTKLTNRWWWFLRDKILH